LRPARDPDRPAGGHIDDEHGTAARGVILVLADVARVARDAAEHAPDETGNAAIFRQRLVGIVAGFTARMNLNAARVDAEARKLTAHALGFLARCVRADQYPGHHSPPWDRMTLRPSWRASRSRCVFHARP